MPVSTLEVPENLADQIAKQLVEAEGAGAITGAGAGDVKQQFCQHWPAAKQVLEVLKAIIPGGGIAIGLVISLGDGAHKAFCG